MIFYSFKTEKSNNCSEHYLEKNINVSYKS